MKLPKSESKTVEFKTAFNQDTIVSLVAFANADGGSVYVGVRDDGKVVGVSLAEESETAWVNEIKNKTAPAIVPEADRLVVDGKNVVRLYIAPLPVKPTSVQGRYYVRKGKANHLMSISELSDMYLRAMSSSWDAMPSNHSLEDISLEKVAAFAKRMNPDNPDDPMRILRKLSLFSGNRPTNACYLAFALDYCFETSFQVGRFKTGSHIIDDKAFNCDLLGEIDGIMAFIMKHLMGEIVITGKPQHDIRYDYPVDAIREIVLNMLVHRDYCNPHITNTIKIFDDHIEFTNAGGLPDGLTVEDILSDDYISSPRNPKLAALFRDAGLIEKYGSGIKRVLDSCKAHGGVRAYFEDHGNWFKVVLTKLNNALTDRLGEKLGEKLGKRLGKTRASILSVLQEEPSLSITRLAAKVGVSTTAIEKNITWLKSNGYLLRVGSARAGRWEVVGVGGRG